MINISYNNKAFLPSPNVSISTEYLTLGGSGVSKQHRISLNGILYNSGTNYYSFSNNGSSISGIFRPETTGILSIGSVSYSVKPISCNLEPTNDNWSQTIRFSMDFEGVLNSEDPNFNSDGNWLVSKIQDDWSIEPLDENFKKSTSPTFDTRLYTRNLATDFYQSPFNDYPYFKITRVLGAVGRYEPVNNNPSLENAKLWIDNYTNSNKGSLNTFLSNFNNVYNHTRNVSKSSTEGSYIITDTWVASRNNNNNYIQTLNIDSSLSKEALRTVTINGEIKGLSVSNKTFTDAGPSGNIIASISDANEKYTNALSRFDSIKASFNAMATAFIPNKSAGQDMIYDTQFAFKNNGNNGFNRLESPINPIPMSSGITHNKTEGSIKFNIVYNNRPINYFNGISETINIQDSLGVDKIITQVVMYGPPIIQNLGTKSSNTRTISIDVKLYNDPTIQSSITYYNNLKAAQETCKTLAAGLDPKNVLENVVVQTLKIDSFKKDESARIDVMNNSLSYSLTYEWVFKGKGIQ
jgi:hypothetical protein